MTALAVGACSLGFDADAFTRGSETTALPDAEADATPDAAAAADASDASPGFVCPAGALLCDDFERNQVTGAFDKAYGPVAIGSTARGGTRGLSARVTGEDMPYLAASFASPGRVHIALWFNVKLAPPAHRVRLFHALFGPACDWDLVWQVSVSSEGLSVSTETYDEVVNPGCGSVSGFPRLPLTPSEVFGTGWHRLDVTLDVRTRDRRADFRVDDGQLYTITVPSKRSAPPEDFEIGIGIPCVQTTGGCFAWDRDPYEVVFDDLVVEPVE